MKGSICRSCGKKVAFMTDENGKTQILDLVAPVYTTTHGGDRDCRRLKLAYVSHFATCPNASKHSKKKEE